MTTQNTEAAFEATVESMLAEAGWESGHRDDWDAVRALSPDRVVAFVRDTQPGEWERMSALHGASLDGLLVEQLVRELDLKGTLDVLRHGFRFQGRTLRVAWFKPAHGLNPEAVARYDRNLLTVTRQALCHPGKGDEIDLLFDVNGIPVATCELKNPMTGQTWRSAERQYKQDRDPNAPVFRFRKRALVHFAADTEEVHMTTRLAGSDTTFLAFNRGNRPGEVRCGAGNPEHLSGYRTGYFWQEVLKRDQFLRILRSYVFVEKRDVKIVDAKGPRTERRENVIFPRYHQLDAVTRLLDAARSEGPGNNYLIQHSAGSGKTNSISWLSHQLASLHTDQDEKVFDCVIVVTDRRVLDSQLQDAIYQIEHAQGVVQAIDQNSRQLGQALTDGTKIVITTLQKFPFVMRGLLSAAGAIKPEDATDEEHAEVSGWARKIAGRKYAVIVDEAHSSQSGDSAKEMKKILGARGQTAGGDETWDWEDGLNAVVESRGPQPNLSFFAFTATPKGKTIELFGRRPSRDEPPRAFHVYSMRQAIEEKFILDVLTNYTDYDTYYKLVQQAEDDPEFPKRKTARKLARFVALHPYNLAQKTEVIIEHFRNQVRHRIRGTAKAMVVTSSRLHAVRYKQAFDEYIAERGYDDVRSLVAFSGTVVDPENDAEYTEPGMNIDVVTGKPISEAALPARFDSPDYHVLLVAEKYQTGYDQPLLQAMYVDKKLEGLHAVQTLSRLNRIAPHKEATFVLDFVNDPDDIREAFAPYYDQTELLATSDPHKLDELRHELDGMQVYHQDEVDEFARVFFLPFAKQSADYHPLLEKALALARGRFRELDDEDTQELFRDRLSAFVKLYGFLSQIIPYSDSELERLAAFGRALLPSLYVPAEEDFDIADDVELEYYRLQQMSSGAIELAGDEQGGVTSPTDTGTGGLDEVTAALSEVIKQLNERFGTQFTESERLFLAQIREDATQSDKIRQTALANTYDNFELAVFEQLATIMLERMAGNDQFVNRCLSDPDFKTVIFGGLAKELFTAIRGETDSRSEPRA